MISWRLNFLKLFFIVLLVAITARLFYWQVISYNRYAIAATSQHLSTITIDAPRGRILASDGNILVSNKRVYLLYGLIPDIKKSLDKNENYENKVNSITNSLDPILYKQVLSQQKDPDKLSQKDKETIDANLKNKISSGLLATNVIWVPLMSKLSQESVDAIKKLNIPGIGFEDQNDRFYPEEPLASSLLGFVGKDSDGSDLGYQGIEGFYNDQLQGQSGTLTQEVDASGKPIISIDSNDTRPKQGLDIQTTIDRTVQYTVEKYLFDGAQKFGAKSASAVVMDPKTGAVLAMASFPNFDGAKWNQFSAEERSNSAISDVYEPGSTFKINTSSSALDLGVVKPDTICPCDGALKIAGYSVETWNNKYNPNSNMASILEHSDNVGAAFWAEKMGKTNFITAVKNFGFGSLTGIDLQGEETGILKRNQDWGEIDLVTGAFGQGLSVTPLQMVAAVSAVANGGKLMKPYVVQKVITQTKEITTTPETVRTVIKPETSSIMKDLLLAAVENGEAKRIIPHGLRVAGKTGTAQIPLNGKYDPNKTVASFIGFGPVENPRFVMIIKYYEPTPIYGAETAEPTFFKIAQELYNYWGIPITP